MSHLVRAIRLEARYQAFLADNDERDSGDLRVYFMLTHKEPGPTLPTMLFRSSQS